MSKRDLKRKKSSGDTLMGFTMMEIGIILALVAQSLSATYRLLALGSGALLLFFGIVFFVHSLTKDIS